MEGRPELAATALGRSFRALGFALIVLGLYQTGGAPAFADDLSGAAAQLSDQAFSLLNSLNAQSNGAGPNPALGPVAGFAADAQTLSHALGKSDSAAASHAMADLQSDRAAIDAAVAAHPGAIKAPDWDSLKNQLDKLAKAISPSAAPASSAANAARPEGGAGRSKASGPEAPASGSAGSATASGAATRGPNVTINYRRLNRGIFHVKGWFEGTALKSAGIFDGSHLRRSLNVEKVAGEQRVNFDMELAGVTPETAIRVYDADGRSAEAAVAPEAEAPAAAEAAAGNRLEAPAPAVGGSASTGIETERSSSHAADSSGTNTAEIPSHGGMFSPAPRRGRPSGLADVQINILSAAPSFSVPNSYEVVGQISGRGIRRAGIYIDGRLLKPIAISDGTSFSSFDETFPMNGTKATIRAYGAGNQFVESSIDISANGPPPVVAAYPGQLSVQITSVRPVATNLYVVAGVISGSNLASAGLYQNGMLRQALSVQSGFLSSLLPGSYRSVNFTAQFNPLLGPGVVRAYDGTGASAEQPITVAGYGMSPYGGINPYSAGVSPYSPYGPYGNPYNPYVNPSNPYAPRTSPYGPGTNPYGYGTPYSYPNAAPPRPPWWQQLLP